MICVNGNNIQCRKCTCKCIVMCRKTDTKRAPRSVEQHDSTSAKYWTVSTWAEMRQQLRTVEHLNSGNVLLYVSQRLLMLQSLLSTDNSPRNACDLSVVLVVFIDQLLTAVTHCTEVIVDCLQKCFRVTWRRNWNSWLACTTWYYFPSQLCQRWHLSNQRVVRNVVTG